MDHDETPAVREGRVLRSTPHGADTLASPWTPALSVLPLDGPAGPMDDGQRQVADNVVLGHD
jgi:hypothetical protein